MKSFLFTFLFLSFFYTGYSQINFNLTNYMYGVMANSKDTLVGYFSFEKIFDQSGQSVYYMRDPNSGRVSNFKTRKFDYFQGDSIYMETFRSYNGMSEMMIPRIINGRIQLFYMTRKNSPYFKKIDYFVKKDNQKIAIRKKTFKTQMSVLVKDNQALLDKIERGELKFNDIKEVILLYNGNNPAL